MDDKTNEGETGLCEPTTAHFDAPSEFTTALSLDSKDKYYSCAREDGLVAIHDATTGKLVRKAYRHSASTTVVGLCWSESGKYMVSADDGGYIIAKRLAPKQEEGTWAVFPVFDHRLNSPVTHLVFSADEKFLLISTPFVDYVWDLKAKKEVVTKSWPLPQSRRWIQHPSEMDVLIRIAAATNLNKNFLIIYATTSDDGTLVPSSLGYTDIGIEVLDTESLALDTINDSDATKQRRILSVEKQAKHLLGVYKTNLAFLDHNGWVCTWNVGDDTEKVTRHFFVPKDWLKTGMSHMAKANGEGTFFCPRYGDVAIVRNGIRI
ncbi:hypothetical protein QBC44DRAFT_373122 [Cladorrhinum sp. PSN332]|nr:hypothetical protein QBC44DRAFT_373122 [Cladorrhinum sp. PSN332]